ncbi:hypothetical protein OSB04_020349 [Centaurea solstitialis]|uniref:Uncharacterized protein n=1 Tax=Centaurea solstitialis TaxID=347529 RepID=A0AA38WGR2_9ASTR|nr:hypothetical protein OSB04_020349 [Centaurea solstitialis]
MSDSDDDFDLMIDQVLLANLQAAELVGKLVTTGVLQNNGEGPSNKRPRGPNKERGREEGHDKLIADYFSNNPVEYFKQHWDARGVKGFSVLQKCTSAIRQLAYGSASDASDEYLRMSETTSRDCLENFCKGIIYLYMRQYLRKPTASDIQRIYAMHEQVHGLPGMLGSIDYKALDSSFVVNGTHYNHGYYLADGIYPEWTTFVKAFRYPHDDERRIHFKERQESARKDIEWTFATLQSKWHMVKRPARVWTRTKLQEIMYTCIILHNMIREDEGISDYPFDPTEVLPEDIETNISEADRARNVNLVKNRERHANLRQDGSGKADVVAEMGGMGGMAKDGLRPSSMGLGMHPVPSGTPLAHHRGYSAGKESAGESAPHCWYGIGMNVDGLVRSNSGNNSHHSIRSSSIRGIIGDRRFNDQFSHVNTQGTEVKKVKRMKVGEAETESDDLPNLRRNASSVQFEATEDQRGRCGDLSAKTSEYAFFKKIKENTCSNVNVHPKYHDNQLDNVQQSDHFTREEIHDVQKDVIKYGRSSFPVEKGRGRDDAHCSFLSPPCCGSKNPGVNHVFGTSSINAQKVRPGGYNWLSPYIGSKTKTSGEYSSSNYIKEIYIGLMGLRDPVLGHTKNHSKRKLLPSFSESELATPIKNHEAYKRKLTESHHISYLDDGFPRSKGKLVDMDLVEWDPTSLQSWSLGQAPSSSFLYNRSHTDGDFGISNFAIEGISLFDKPLSRYESIKITELEELDFDYGPKLLEQPQTLLLGWENDGFHLSERNSDDDYQLCLPDRFISSPPSSLKTRFDSPYHVLDGTITPYIDRHREEKHFLDSSYAPKHRMLALEDCGIEISRQDYALNEKEREVGAESFMFLIQSPANNVLRFLNTGLRSFVVDDENDENFVYGSDRLLEGSVKGCYPLRFMESFHDEHFDHIGYPLLLHDSSMNE